MEAGKAAECKTVLVTTGPNQGNSRGQGKPPDYVASDLYKAAEWIIEKAKLRIAQAKRK